MSMLPRPKVCHLMHDGSSSGGGATFAVTSFPAYVEEFDTFAIVGRDGDLAERLRRLGVRSVTLPMERPWRSLLSWPRLWKILQEERPDLIVVHGQWGGFFGAVAARAAKIGRIVYYTHFPSFYTDWDLARTIRNRIAESVTCRLATMIVCVGRASRYQYLLRRLADESKLIYLPNSVRPEALSATLDRTGLLRDLGLPHESTEPVAVSVSRLADQKRIDWLLRAWAQVEARSARGRLAIVGDGPEGGALRRLAADLRLTRCHFLGPQREGYRYFGAANFGVISSLFEGLPLAPIEAMFLGCAMIGTDVNGIRELIDHGKTGLLVPPGEPVALADAILELMADPERTRRMGAAARVRAEADYDAKEVLPRQLQLVREMLGVEGS
jgi:glycosyltransferase involved in cell wall biosynthesis